ncbi:MAG: hypothetical protein FJ272_11895 [Planctomycetes bacterium]|nr:hypothetical protein [Planctomycetota bacterium]MBM4085484.1 hypothetical protein [Planctomycetota bacterium]
MVRRLVVAGVVISSLAGCGTTSAPIPATVVPAPQKAVLGQETQVLDESGKLVLRVSGGTQDALQKIVDITTSTGTKKYRVVHTVNGEVKADAVYQAERSPEGQVRVRPVTVSK